MKMQRFVLIVLALASVAALVPATAEAGTSGFNVFVPLPPCRILDTRVASGGAGPVTVASPRNVNIVGTTSNPGGAAGGCGVPAYDLVDGPIATAVAINITTTGQAGNGNFKVWAPVTGTEPGTSIINFRLAQSIANWAVVPLDQDAVEGNDLIFKTTQQSELILDVMGYFVDHDQLAP